MRFRFDADEFPSTEPTNWPTTNRASPRLLKSTFSVYETILLSIETDWLSWTRAESDQNHSYGWLYFWRCGLCRALSITISSMPTKALSVTAASGRASPACLRWWANPSILPSPKVHHGPPSISASSAWCRAGAGQTWLQKQNHPPHDHDPGHHVRLATRSPKALAGSRMSRRHRPWCFLFPVGSCMGGPTAHAPLYRVLNSYWPLSEG